MKCREDWIGGLGSLLYNGWASGKNKGCEKLQIIRGADLVEGRWRNGQGVSWEIAAHHKEGAADFSWRFAKARIDSDVPFSIYPGMDRIFMMIEGQGMDLVFEGGKVLHVHEKFVPHEFSCDVSLECKLQGGPSLDLNLFAARGLFKARCDVRHIAGSEDLKFEAAVSVIYVLENNCVLNGTEMRTGDCAVVEGQSSVHVQADNSRLYLGHLQNVKGQSFGSGLR
jgi:uncharacterized protein